MDWKYLYISRVFRLVPLYLFAILLLFLTVGALSGWEVRQSGNQIMGDVLTWLTFTIGGRPDINGVADTSLILAGVTWSLPYEWLFYFTLPVFGCLFLLRPSIAWLAGSLIMIAFIRYNWHPEMSVVRCFWGGVAAAFLVRLDVVKTIAKNHLSSSVVLITLVYVAAHFPVAYTPDAQIMLAVAFILIASGNTVFGLLTLPVSRTLGEMAYSIYLLHGFILFVVFRGIIGIDLARTFSMTQYWATISCVSSALVCCSFVTYSLIEKPFMRLAVSYRTTKRPG